MSQINKTLSTLVKSFGELKTEVVDIESQVNNLKIKRYKNASDIVHMKKQHDVLSKDTKELHQNFKEVTSNLQGISDFMDDFKLKHENNVKDVKQIKTPVSKRRPNDRDASGDKSSIK